MIVTQILDGKTILVSYPDLPMKSGYETNATLQAWTHDYSAHRTVMEELLQLNGCQCSTPLTEELIVHATVEQHGSECTLY